MRDLEGRCVLVTGAAGRLGRAVVRQLADRGVTVNTLDLRPTEPEATGRAVTGSASDPEAVSEALQGTDAVIHLAALASPRHGTAEEVFCGNTAATFTVLEAAAAAGVRRGVIASSYAATGLPFSPRRRHPAYLPIDEQLPLFPEDPYALAKQVDEHIAALMWWRHQMSVACLRLPYLGSLDEDLPRRAAKIADDPAFAAAELWMYLELRDAARAFAAALAAELEGFFVIGVAAPETLAEAPTGVLLDEYHPEVPRRRPIPGRGAPIDLFRAHHLLSWHASELWNPAAAPVG